jgi:nucleoid-associated protein YgaU
MRTELKIGVTVLLVVSVMALVYFVFIAPDRTPQKPTKENLGTIAGSPEPNRVAGARPDRGGRALRPASPTPSPAIHPEPSPSPIAMIPPVSLVPPSTSRPAIETIADSGLRSPTPSPEPVVSPRPDRSPDATLIPPVTMAPPPSPSPRAAEPARSAPPAFEPTPIYVREPPRVETIAPVAVDDRAVLAPVRPGAVEANAAATGPRTGLVRKADGKDYYVVQKDDKGYWGIAEKPFVYGDGRKWDLIAKANPNADPARLQVNQELVIPPLVRVSETHPIVSGSTTHPAGAHGQYVIKSGDTLESIAKSQYGDGALWQLIAKANPDVDPARLRIGKELVIPPAPAGRTPTTVPVVVAPVDVLPASPAPSPTSRPASPRRGSPSPSPAAPTTERTAPARTTPPGWD